LHSVRRKFYHCAPHEARKSATGEPIGGSGLEHCTAIVLAAVRSERMGTSKARLFVGERRALDRVLAASEALPRRSWSEPDSAPRRARRSGRLTVAINEHAERGPLSSLQIALASECAPGRSLSLFPVDYALVERRGRGAGRSRPRAPPRAVLIPTHGGRNGHPVVFAGALASELCARSAPGAPHATSCCGTRA
jgi:CTP:molybdopterin cytidylyltransferase MocA